VVGVAVRRPVEPDARSTLRQSEAKAGAPAVAGVALERLRLKQNQQVRELNLGFHVFDEATGRSVAGSPRKSRE
jgi:hypothetical protein